MKSKEELQGSEELCAFCPLDEQDKGIHCYGGNISMCEGSRCDDAYDAYCEQQATSVTSSDDEICMQKKG
jgi:hypothetical protein